MSHTFALLVPVKSLALAKTRLSIAVAGDREALMRAFALDAIAAALRSPVVSQVHVVSDDTPKILGAERAAHWLRRGLVAWDLPYAEALRRWPEIVAEVYGKEAP